MSNFIEFLPPIIFNNEYLRLSIVLNPSTPNQIINELLLDPNSIILEKLIKYKGILVSSHLIGNPILPSYILQQLANDEEDVIRYRLAENPNTPINILEQLANDKDERLQKLVEKNLKMLAKQSNQIVGNKANNISSETNNQHILEQTITVGDPYIRRKIAIDPNTPEIILEQLVTDENERVRANVSAKS